jgi:hypothetical protein
VPVVFEFYEVPNGSPTHDGNGELLSKVDYKDLAVELECMYQREHGSPHTHRAGRAVPPRLCQQVAALLPAKVCRDGFVLAGPMFALDEIRAEFEAFFEQESTRKLEKVLHPVNLWHAIWVAEWGAKKRPPDEVKGPVKKVAQKEGNRMGPILERGGGGSDEESSCLSEPEELGGLTGLAARLGEGLGAKTSGQVGPKEPSSSKDPAAKPGNSPTKPPGMAAASSGAAPPKLPFGLSLLDEEPTLKEHRLRDSDVDPQDNNKQGGEGDADGVGDDGTAAILDPIGQGATGNSASSAELDKVYSVAPETLALLRSASSLVSLELTRVSARGGGI